MRKGLLLDPQMTPLGRQWDLERTCKPHISTSLEKNRSLLLSTRSLHSSFHPKLCTKFNIFVLLDYDSGHPKYNFISKCTLIST